MADREQVEEFLRERLIEDSEKQMEKAGDLWKSLQFDFFYLDGGDIAEDAVDLAVDHVVGQVEELDGIKIPEAELDNLINEINADTKVDSAISLIHLATFQPILVRDRVVRGRRRENKDSRK